MIGNLTPRQHILVALDRLDWYQENADPACLAAFNDITRSGEVSFPDLVAAAERNGADPLIFLAMCGWLPGTASGGPPFFHINDWRADGKEVFLFEGDHATAYCFLMDLVHDRLPNFSPYPRIVTEGRP